MPYKKHFSTITDLIFFYVDLYYKNVERHKEVRQNPEKHLILVNHINYDFDKALKKRSDQFDYEENKGAFLHRMESLTQVQKRMREVEDKRAKQKEVADKFFGSRKKVLR